MEEIEGEEFELYVLVSEEGNIEEVATCDTSDDSREISDSPSVSRKRAIGCKKQQSIKKIKITTSENGNDVFAVSNSKHHKSYSNLVEKLENENTFKNALGLLTKLLEQGKCTEETAIEFYLCFQAVRSQYLHLVEKREFEGNVYLHFISELFAEIDSLFCLYKQHRIWKFFSENQKKNMELWIKHFREWKSTFNDDLEDIEQNLDEFDNSCASNSKSDTLAEERANIPSEEQRSNRKKQRIFLKNCVLYPPDSEVFVGKKPLGCRTVLVSGLPEKVTKDIIGEIFGLCGTIKTIWQPTTRFCHVQYVSGIFIENAVQLSGYRLKIQNRDESLYSSVIHVAYLSEDDHLNYICNIHNSQALDNDLTCIDLESLCDRLKDKDTFQDAASTLVTYLEQEDLGQDNTDYVYSILEAINQHFVGDLLIQKDEIVKKLSAMNREESVNDCALISKIYETALLEGCQQNFTEEEKENILSWKRQVEELVDSFVGDQENIDQDPEIDNDQLKEQVSRLEEERDSLKSQLESARERLRRVQIAHDEEMRVKDAEYDAVMNGLCSLRFHFRLLLESRNEINRRQEEERNLEEAAPDSTSLGLGSSSSSSSSHLNDEARLISLISMFINSYPYGARIDDICSYLQQFDSRSESQYITDLMERYVNIFREDFNTDDGLRRWYFNGFQM